MKNTTKILTLILILLLLFSITACKEEQANDELKSVTLYIVSQDNTRLAEYQKTVSFNSLADLLTHLKTEEEAFDYTVVFVQYLSSITVSADKGLFPKDNEFIALYHTINDMNYRDYTVANKMYNNIEFYFSAYGIDDTPLIDKAVYLITINSFS